MSDELHDVGTEETHLRHRLMYLKPAQFDTKKEFLEAKTKIQLRYDECVRKQVLLRDQHDVQLKKGRIERTKVFVSENIHLLVIEKDNAKMPIDKEALTVTFPFVNCKHVKTLALNALLQFNNERLWQDIFSKGLSIPLRFNCQQCIKEKQSLFRKFRRYTNEPIGQANLTIRGLH